VAAVAPLIYETRHAGWYLLLIKGVAVQQPGAYSEFKVNALPSHAVGTPFYAWSLTMNSTGTGSVVLCPLDGRRSSQELYVKFFIVNFTTITFYLHFVRRRDTHPDWALLFFFLAPLNLVFLYALAILVIFGRYGLGIFYSRLRHRRQSVSRDTLTTPLRWLFGKARCPPSLPDMEENTPPRPLTLSSATRSAVVNGAFLTQCAGCVFLYRRRRQHHAVTLVDQKIFEAATGGLIVGVLNTCRSFLLPTFNDFVPSNDNMTKMDRFALTCRDSYGRLFRGSDEASSLQLLIMKNAVISFIVLILSMDTGLFSKYHMLYDRLRDRYRENPAYLIIFCYPTLMYAGIILFLFYEKLKERGSCNMLTKYPLLLLIICSVPAVLAFALIMIVSYGIFYVLCMWILSYVSAFDQVVRLSATPQNVTCPLLWSDPVAQWVWALA
jgi:hypothetical protein